MTMHAVTHTLTALAGLITTLGCATRDRLPPALPSGFEVSARLLSAGAAVGESIGVVVTAVNTNSQPIEVPVRYGLSRVPCEGNREALFSDGAQWGAGFGARLGSGAAVIHKAPAGCTVWMRAGSTLTDTVWLRATGAGSFLVVASFAWKVAQPIPIVVTP